MFKRVEAPATGRSPVASRIPLSGSGEELTARRVEGVTHGRHTVGQGHVLWGGKGRAPRSAAVGARDRLPVGRVDVFWGGTGRDSRGAAVGARERVPVEREDVLGGGVRWASLGAAVGARERLPEGRESAVRGRRTRPRGGGAGAVQFGGGLQQGNG
jgi:hypothetical protein